MKKCGEKNWEKNSGGALMKRLTRGMMMVLRMRRLPERDAP